MKKIATLTAMALVGSLTAAALTAAESAARVELKHNEPRGQLQVLVDGKEAVVYQYGANVDMPHYYPVRSPSGRLLTVQQTEPYPHHRSLWFADTVQLAGQRKASFYNALYSKDKKDPKAPYRDQIRHVEFVPGKVAGNQGEIGMKLLWVIDQQTPVLDEQRQLRVVALDQGQYLLDMQFTVIAAYGNVQFLSDQAHYAWPYVRMNPEFSVQKGGTMTNSEGGVNQAGTHNKRAYWIDYSNKVGGATEGMAFFLYDRSQPAPLWLTRDYGTFGPRRPNPQNGKPFVLKKGESLKQRVGILVHSGDVKAGQVEKHYQQYADGKL
jgi:hypothetical protein